MLCNIKLKLIYFNTLVINNKKYQLYQIKKNVKIKLNTKIYIFFLNLGFSYNVQSLLFITRYDVILYITYGFILLYVYLLLNINNRFIIYKL